MWSQIRNGKLYCTPEKTLKRNKYNIYDEETYLGYTYINPPIDITEFKISSLITKIGTNNISITSNDFYLETIDKIVIKDNDGNSVVFFRNTILIQENNYFTFSDNNNEIK